MSLLPTRFFYAGDQTLVSQIAEADSADAELPINGSGATAETTAVFHTA
jgi:hypothetical protein